MDDRRCGRRNRGPFGPSPPPWMPSLAGSVPRRRPAGPHRRSRGLLGGPATSAPPSAAAASAPPDTPVTAPPSDPSVDPIPATAGRREARRSRSRASSTCTRSPQIACRRASTARPSSSRPPGAAASSPATILDSIVVDQGEGTYAITLREGHGPQDIACIAIAEQHITEFEIPNVAPGTYDPRLGRRGATDRGHGRLVASAPDARSLVTRRLRRSAARS